MIKCYFYKVFGILNNVKFKLYEKIPVFDVI